MKVVLINGSPRAKGNTATILGAMCEELEKEAITTEIIHVSKDPVRGCIACGSCGKTKNKRCVFDDDAVNSFIDTLSAADGIVIGSPVYYAGIAGTLKCFLDRTFYVSTANGGLFQRKVGAAVSVARRAGGVPTVDALNEYFQVSGMVMPSGFYWNSIHGAAPGECLKDLEGMQNARTLAQNMAWLVKLIEHGKNTVKVPVTVERATMNFIR